jgi:hypothetical protein
MGHLHGLPIDLEGTLQRVDGASFIDLLKAESHILCGDLDSIRESDPLSESKSNGQLILGDFPTICHTSHHLLLTSIELK